MRYLRTVGRGDAMINVVIVMAVIALLAIRPALAHDRKNR